MAINITSEDAFAYAELLEILSFTEKSALDKIPEKLIEVFKQHALPTYKKHINPNLPLDKQNISNKTTSLITLITLNYWCESKEQKEQIKDKLRENEIRKTKELKEKYSYENLFDNSKVQSEIASINREDSNDEDIFDLPNLPMDYTSFPWYKKIVFQFKKWLSFIFDKIKNPT